MIRQAIEASMADEQTRLKELEAREAQLKEETVRLEAEQKAFDEKM